MNTNDTISLLQGLNSPQRQAVEYIHGPLLVLAGPGSGKTRVITHRIAYLIKYCGVKPQNILAVTFTNKAANEMRERVEQLAPGQVTGLTMGTFHSICSRLLRREGAAIGMDTNFVIYDDSDQQSLVRRIIKELNLDDKMYRPSAVLSHISNAKSELRGPSEYAELASSYLEEIVSRIYRRYQELLAENRALDFDDLLMTTVRLFRECPEVLERYQTRYEQILVDEFQDTNVAQYVIVKLLGGKHRNVCVVGDEDQSIYSWRKADIRNILNFEHDYPETRTIYLEQNYRSTKTILTAAQQVIASNSMRKEKKLWTDRPQGHAITMNEAYNEQEEAAYVVNQIERLVAGGQCKLGDCAVMYRVNAQSRVIEDAFRRRGIPYRLVGTKFYDRKEIKDILAYLRFIYNPYDTAGMLRIINVPARALGQKTVEELMRLASRIGVPPIEALRIVKYGGDSAALSDTKSIAGPFSGRAEQSLINFVTLYEDLYQASTEMGLAELIEFVLKRSGYGDFIKDGSEEGLERWENIRELGTVAADYANLEPRVALATFLEEIALVADADEYEAGTDVVTMITLHAAKGLEFSVVFIVGMEEGLCPHMRSFDDNERMEEERRLCYVGMTRAKEQLFLTYTFRRRMAGSSAVNAPSRYLADISEHLVKGRPDTAGEKGNKVMPASRPEIPRLMPNSNEISRPERKQATKASFRVGDRVRHSKFGEGIVLELQGGEDDEQVVVLFSGAVGRKALALNFARLEKLI